MFAARCTPALMLVQVQLLLLRMGRTVVICLLSMPTNANYSCCQLLFKVALKMLKPHMDKRAKERETFMREMADTLETARYRSHSVCRVGLEKEDEEGPCGGFQCGVLPADLS